MAFLEHRRMLGRVFLDDHVIGGRGRVAERHHRFAFEEGQLKEFEYVWISHAHREIIERPIALA